MGVEHIGSLAASGNPAVGQKRLYTPELAASILSGLCEGRSLRSICQAEGMPTESAVRAWAVANHDGFGDRMERARVLGCHALADEILEIADRASDSDSAAAARVQTENRRWLLSKLLPKTYGDRLDVSHSVDLSVANALTEARRRFTLLEAPSTTIEMLRVGSDPSDLTPAAWDEP